MRVAVQLLQLGGELAVQLQQAERCVCIAQLAAVCAQLVRAAVQLLKQLFPGIVAAA